MTDIQQKGGIFIGKSHAQGGIDVVVPETGQRLEVEGKEPLIPKEALSDNKVYTYTGTNFDILNKINTSIGAKSITQKATTVHAGDVIICKKTLYDNTTKTLHGTHKQIVSAINENAGCSTIEPGAVMHKENGEVLQFEDGGNIPENNALYKEWKELVNMSAKEVADFKKTPEGKKAGLSKTEAKKQGVSSGQESAEWVIKMKNTPKKEWTAEMWKWAKKQINFIKRMSGVKGDLYDEKGNKTRKHTSLLIWGHNPEKMKLENGGSIPQNKEWSKEKCLDNILLQIAEIKEFEFHELQKEDNSHVIFFTEELTPNEANTIDNIVKNMATVCKKYLNNEILIGYKENYKSIAIQFKETKEQGGEIELPLFQRKQRNIWIPNLTTSKLESLLSKPVEQLTDDDKEDLLDFKYFIIQHPQYAYEKGLMDAYITDDGNIYLPKNKYWVTNIDNATKGFNSEYWVDKLEQGGEIKEKQGIALKDLESRLTIAKKMAAKNPDFKGRIKIIEKMMEKMTENIRNKPEVVRYNYYIRGFGGYRDVKFIEEINEKEVDGLTDLFFFKEDDYIGIGHLPTGLKIFAKQEGYDTLDNIKKELINRLKEIDKKEVIEAIKNLPLSPRYSLSTSTSEELIEKRIKTLYEEKNFKELYDYVYNSQNKTSRKYLSDIIGENIVNYNRQQIDELFKKFGYDIYAITKAEEIEKQRVKEEASQKELDAKKDEYPYLNISNISPQQLARLDNAMQKQWRFGNEGIMTLSEWIKKNKNNIIEVEERVSYYDSKGNERSVPKNEYVLKYKIQGDDSIYIRDIPKLAYDNWNNTWANTTKLEQGGIIPPSGFRGLLTDLYKDHHEAWAYMDAISKEVNQENCTACAKKIIAKFNDELKHHFDEEEQDFFPYVKKKQNKLNSLIIDELIIQHKWFLAKINEMEQHPTPAAIKEFCNQLIEHIKLEEYLMNKYLKDPFKNNDMEKTMTLKQITEILDKSQIPYNRKLSHIYGSEYWDIRGVGYRLSDHPKSKWRQSERIEISLYGNNYQPLYEELLQRKDIDLTDKTNWEKEYIEFAKKTIIPREKDGLLVTPDGSLYNNDEQGLINATKGMWNRKVYFPIKNKGLNDFVKKEALKKELNNLYDYGTEEEIEKIKKQLSEVEILQNGGQADFISSAETQRRRVENMNEPQRAEELSKEVMKIYRNKTNKLFRPEDGIVKVYANIYKINPEHTAEIFNTNASKIVDQLFEQGGQAPLKPLPNTTIQMKEQSQNKTGYEKFKVTHTNNNKPEIEEFDYYSDALESFEKHKKQGHIPRLEGWHNATDFNVIMRTPKYQKGDKVTMFDDEPALTIEKVNEWSDKLATYDLSSANGVIDRRNISETKLSLYNEEVKMADGGEIPSKELIIKHLNTLPHEKFADDAAYILSADLDKILWRSEEEEGRKVISEQVADKIISSENANTYLKEISYFKNGGVVAASTKINFEPTTEAQLRISLLAIKEQYPDNKREASSGYYMVQNNFFNEVVSYNPTMLVALLKVGKEILNKGDRFVVGNILLPDFKDANTERFFSNLSVPLWTLIPNELRNVQPIKQLPFSPSPKNNNLAKITDLFVGTDDLRPNMMGAYFDVTNNAIVATNANIMLHIDEKPTIKEDEICILGKNTKKFSELDENNSKNLQAIKDGCLKVDANYPAWTRVIPRDFDNIVTVKTEEVYKFCKILVENKLTPPITNHILLLNEKLKLGITAVFLVDSLKAMLLLGYKEVDFCFQEDANRPIMILPKGNARKISAASDNIETDFVLIMPVGLDSDRFSVNYNWTYDLDKKCIENEGLEKLGCVDLDTTEEAKVETSLIKPGDFVQKKHTHNKHYFVESVNNDKLTLINTVTLKKVTDANAVDYTPIKETEKEGVEYAYNFNKRKAETEKLKKQHPIVLESTEASDVANKTYNNLEELEADLKSFGFTDTPTKTYIKNKVWFRGYPHHIQIDLSKMDHDFNPEEEKLLTWLKNYDNKFDFEQFSEAIKKQQKQAKKQKVAEIMEAIETLEALLPIMDNAADKKAIRKQIEVLDKQLGEGNFEKFVDYIYKNESNVPITRVTDFKKLVTKIMSEIDWSKEEYDFKDSRKKIDEFMKRNRDNDESETDLYKRKAMYLKDYGKPEDWDINKTIEVDMKDVEIEELPNNLKAHWYKGKRIVFEPKKITKTDWTVQTFNSEGEELDSFKITNTTEKEAKQIALKDDRVKQADDHTLMPKMAKGGVITEYPTKYIIDNNIVLRVKVITEYEEDGKQLAFVSGPFSKESRKLVNKSDLFNTREEAENFLGDWQSIGYFKNGGESKNITAKIDYSVKVKDGTLTRKEVKEAKDFIWNQFEEKYPTANVHDLYAASKYNSLKDGDAWMGIYGTDDNGVLFEGFTR